MRRMTIAVFALAVCSFLVSGCPSDHRLPSDRRPEDAHVDKFPDTTFKPDADRCEEGESYDPARGVCGEIDPPPDTGFPDTRGDIFESKPDVYGDTRADTSVDTGPTHPTVGEPFTGPTVNGVSQVSVVQNYGIGLYWQSALSQFLGAPHRHLPNRPVVTLSRIRSPIGETNPIWKLPKSIDKKRHFYRNYCDEIGKQKCTNQGIDDDTASFALMMLAIHEAPVLGKASDCTYGLIRGKRQCDYGQTIAASPTHGIVYAYKKIDTSNFPVFNDLGLPAHTLPKGYHTMLFPPKGSSMKPDIIKGTGMAIVFDPSAMFPMLYP